MAGTIKKGPLSCTGTTTTISTTYWKLESQEIETRSKKEKKIRKRGILEKGKKKIEIYNGRHVPKNWFPLSLSKSCSLSETKGAPVYQPFRSASLKVINFHDRISLGDYSLWEEVFFPLWFWSCGSDLIWFLFPLSANPYITHLLILYFLIK